MMILFRSIVRNIRVFQYSAFQIRRLQSLIFSFFAGKYTSAFLIESSGFKFLVDAKDMGVSRTLINKGNYSLKEINSIKSYVNEESTVIFVGCHIGSLSIPIAKEVRKIYMVEANPKTFNLLDMNIKLNDLNNVIPLKLAADEEDGEIEFMLNEVNSGGSKRLPKKLNYNYVYDNPKIIKVRKAKLDNIIMDEEIALVFMDIEGSEYYALKGMKNILKRTQVLIIEFIPDHLKNVSGINVQLLLDEIEGLFNHMKILESEKEYSREEFKHILMHMFQNNISSEGLIFSKKN